MSIPNREKNKYQDSCKKRRQHQVLKTDSKAATKKARGHMVQDVAENQNIFS